MVKTIYAVAFILLVYFLCSCDASKRTPNSGSKVESIILQDYYLYEVEYKENSEDYYGLFLSRRKYDKLSSLKKIINHSDYYLVDKISFNTHFDMKDGDYSINDFNNCESRLNYHEEFLKSIGDDQININVLKITGEFYYRNTYSYWYNSFSTVYLNINKTKKVRVIYAACR